MAGRRLKRKAARDTAAARAQRKTDLLEEKKARLAKARAAKARKLQQLQKEQQKATATTAVASPAGPTEGRRSGRSGVGCEIRQRRRRSHCAEPADRCSDPRVEKCSSPSDDVLEHATAVQEEAALLRRDNRLQIDANSRSDEAHQLGGDEPFIPSGVLVGHRILRLFGNDDGAIGGQDGCLILPTPTSEEAEEVGSAFFIGTVTSYRPPKAYEQLMPKNAVGGSSSSSSSSSSARGVHVDGDGPKKGGRRRGSKKKKSRGGRPRKDAVRELDYALYRVHFDDGDVMDMEPKEVFECSQLYDAKREEFTSSSSRYNGPPPMIMGRDHDDPDQPANLESGLREILRHANPSCDSVLADPSSLRALDTEIQGYWVQYRVHHIQRDIPRPPSMLSDEEHRQYRAAMAALSHRRGVETALLSAFVYDEQLGTSDAIVDSTRGSDASSLPTFDDDIPRTPIGSLSLDRLSHTPTKRTMSRGVCEEEDGKPAAKRHRHRRSDSSVSARAPMLGRGREEVSIVSDDDSRHSVEEAVMMDVTAVSARPRNTREAPNVSPEHMGAESPHASSKVAEDLPLSNPTLKTSRDTTNDLHAETQPTTQLGECTEDVSPEYDFSSVAASANTGVASSGSHTTEFSQVKSRSAPDHSNTDESIGSNVAPTPSRASNGKLYGFEKRASHQHRRMKKPKAQGRARFPVLPLASRKRKKETSSPSDEATASTAAVANAKTVTPSPIVRTLKNLSGGSVNFPNLAPSSAASPVGGRDEIVEAFDSHRVTIPIGDKKPNGTALDFDDVSSQTSEMPTAKMVRTFPTALVKEGEQIQVGGTPHGSEHSVTMHEFAEIMAAPSPARASVTFAASIKETTEEPLASSGPINTGVATTSPEKVTPAMDPLADVIVERMINGEGGSQKQKQKYSILSRAYAVGPGIHRSRGPDIHVVLSAIYEPPSSQTSTKMGSSDSTTSGVLPSLKMQQSQDSASRYMSSDYRYKAESADDSQISSLPNVSHLAQCLAKKYALSGQWSARIDLILSVEGDGFARWPGIPSVDRYMALSVMTGFPPDDFPPKALDGGTSIAGTFREGRVVDIIKGHLRGQRGVVRKIIRPDKLLVMIIENGHEKEHLIMASGARQLSQAEMVRSLLNGPSKQTYCDMNMSDLDHAILVGSPHPRPRNEDFLADVDHMLKEELHEIDTASAMNMFPPGDPGRFSTFVPTSAALSALKASPYSADGRAVRRRRTVRKPKRQGGRRRKSDIAAAVAISAGTTADETTKKKKKKKKGGRKRKNDGNLEPSATKERGRKPVSDDESSHSGTGCTGNTSTKRRGRNSSSLATKRDKPSAPSDGGNTSTQRRRGRAPKSEGRSTLRIKIMPPVPEKVSDEGDLLQLPTPKRRGRGNHWKTKSAQPLPVPKEPAAQKAALDRVETALRKKAKRIKGTEKRQKISNGASQGKGDISVDTWGLLALLGVFEMRDAVSSLGYKPIGNKIDMLVQLSAAYENLGLQMPKIDT